MIVQQMILFWLPSSVLFLLIPEMNRKQCFLGAIFGNYLLVLRGEAQKKVIFTEPFSVGHKKLHFFYQGAKLSVIKGIILGEKGESNSLCTKNIDVSIGKIPGLVQNGIFFFKRDARNAILNTQGKTASAIFSVCNKQIGVSCLLQLNMPIMKPQYSDDPHQFTAGSVNSQMSFALCI